MKTDTVAGDAPDIETGFSSGSEDHAHPERRVPIINRYINETSNLWSENRLLKALLLVLTLLFLVDIAVGISNRHSLRTVVVPFGAENDLQIVGNEPSERYLKAMARNIATLFGTFTAGSVEAQYDELLRFVHPSKYADVRGEFRNLVKQISAFPTIAFAMYPRADLPLKAFETRMDVPVTRIRYLGRTARREEGILRVDYAVEGGRFWITALNFISNTRTKEAGDELVNE